MLCWYLDVKVLGFDVIKLDLFGLLFVILLVAIISNSIGGYC
jgi:hypothetical protein